MHAIRRLTILCLSFCTKTAYVVPVSPIKPCWTNCQPGFSARLTGCASAGFAGGGLGGWLQFFLGFLGPLEWGLLTRH